MQLTVDTGACGYVSSSRNDADVTRHPLRSQNATHCGSVAEARSAEQSAQWACVHTHVGAEHWAQANLRDRGYTTWLPLVAVKRRDRAVRTMWHTVQVPAFSRYVFLQHTPGSPWSPIRYTEGVNDVVRMGMQPAYASDMAIEAVRKALETSLHTKEHQGGGFKVGEAVRLSEGPLRGIDGIALSSDHSHTTVSLVMLGALRHVTVPTHQLIARD